MTNKVTSVLVVEDDSHTLQCERLILEEGGFSVTWASSGEEAIEMVADHAPDLILLDIGLPGIDGFTTCRVIRKFSQVPIIIVTGSSSDPDKVRGLNTGADDYITKPFSDEELFARSKAVLRRSAISDSSLERANCLCGKGLRRHGPANYQDRLRSIARLGKCSLRSLFGSLKDRAAGSADGAESSRWPVLAAKTKLSLVSTRRYLVAGALALATFFRTLALRAWNSPWISRGKATPPAEKLADAATRLLASDPLQKLRYACLGLWRAGAKHLAKFLASFGNHDAPPPSGMVPDDGTDGADYGQLVVPLDPSAPGGPPVAAHTRHMAFLERLLRSYIKVAGTLCSDPMVSAPVVPLVGVYEEMVSVMPVDGGYSQEQFARDIYRLHRSGIDTTPTGARVQFPISRGVATKTLVITDDAGREMRYYGIRFMPVLNPEHEIPPARRSFDVSTADQYSLDIREAFARQLEWPSEEFVQFLAGQLNLALLDHKETRQLAQITRDSLQQFIKELHRPGTP